MTAPDKEQLSESASDAKSYEGWVSFVAVVYRILLVLGLLFLGATVVLTFFTRSTYLWIAIIPLGLIALGILLAHVEYRLYKRMNYPQDQEPKQKVK